MLTKLTKHEHHEVQTRRIYDSPHYGELRCKDCNKHIQWLTKSDYKTINSIIYGRIGYKIVSINDIL